MYAAMLQVSVVSARLGRAGTFGLEKAVQVLDTLGSSMTNLNTGSGFLSGPTIKVPFKKKYTAVTRGGVSFRRCAKFSVKRHG